MVEEAHNNPNIQSVSKSGYVLKILNVKYSKEEKDHLSEWLPGSYNLRQQFFISHHDTGATIKWLVIWANSLTSRVWLLVAVWRVTTELVTFF